MPEDAERWALELPAAMAILGIQNAKQLMQRYDSSLEGSLDVVEMDVLRSDAIKRLRTAQKLAREMDQTSLVAPKEFYEDFDDELLATNSVEQNPLTDQVEKSHMD